MKIVRILAVSAVFLFSNTQSFGQLKNVLTKAATTLSKPSTTEIAAGIKEALEKGISAGAERLAIKDGYLGNASVKILFPSEAQKVEKTLRGMGMNKLCDDVILSINRAAEDAAKEAKPVFVAAIKQMSIADASQILMAKEADAATTYFKGATTAELKGKFKPIIDSCLNKSGAAKYWKDTFAAYNKVPLVKKVNTDLNDYATQKAIDGLFFEIAKEELKIRQNNKLRTSPLLQKVFGYADGK
jgi:hypothetical protein